MSKKLVIEIISALFILLFVYTAVTKLNDFENFRNVLKSSPLIGDKALFVAWMLPIGELIVSLLLFMPRTRVLGLHCSLVLMIVFTAYLSYMLTAAPHLPCSCGGVLQQMSWKEHLVFNICFSLLALLGVWLNRKSRKHNREATQISFT